MKQSIFFYKELTLAEVGNTKTHEVYIRLPNNFDYDSFFGHTAAMNGPVLEVNFTAQDITDNKWETIPLRFAYFINSNKEKRIPSLGALFKKHNVREGDVVCLESRSDGSSISYFICFYKRGIVKVDPSAIYFSKPKCSISKKDVLIYDTFPLQQIFYGAPGTGKSFKIKECTKGDDTVIRTTFHPDSDYSTFVGCYKPTMINKEPVCTVGELINKLSAIKNSGVTYPCDKFAERYWESLKNLSLIEINNILTACGFTMSMNVEIKKGIAVGEYFAKEQKNKKIAYAFVPQAFTKAYIQAWKKMVDYHPKYRTFYVGSTKYDIIGISGDLVRVKVSDSEDSEELEIRKSELEDIFKTKDSHDVEQNHDNDEEQNRNKELWNNPNKLGLNNPNEIKPDPSDIDKIKERLGEILKRIDKSFDDAWKILEKDFLNPQFLIIEEINRGNCAQIFGDLFQLLDRGDDGYSEYPIEADDDLRKELEREFDKLNLDALKHEIDSIFKENYPHGITDKIKSGKLLVLPKNLFIWATMNTSDQSLFPMDSAFKRRWDWECIPIDYENEKSNNFTITIKGKKYNWHTFLQVVNNKILDATGSEDKQMGNFFIKGDVDEKQFINKVMFYLWNDVCKEEYGTNNNFFRYYKDSEKKETEQFTFNKLFESDAKDTLSKFMDFLAVYDEETMKKKSESKETTELPAPETVPES